MLAVHALWAIVAVYAVWRFAQVAERFAPVVVERDDTPAVVVLPADIEALAMAETEPWAQDEVRKVAREQYAGLRDSEMDEPTRWNLVRSALGIGHV